MPNTSEQQRQRAIKNGTWVGERRPTAQLCHNARNVVFGMIGDAKRFGWDDYVPPICDEWLVPTSAGLAVMVNDVISAIGLRPSKWHRLAPDPVGRMHKSNVRYVVRIDGAAQSECECDWLRREACARSRKPCQWAAEQHALDLFDIDGDWFSRGPF